jgi:hypothetical protein
MFSTRKGMIASKIASKPEGGEAMLRPHLRSGLYACALVLAGLTVADPAFARSPYDGAWSVVVMTRGGACQSGMRYGVQIVNGQVVGGEGGASVQGRVAPSGAVSVAVQAGGQWARGSGRLSMSSGGGAWRGQGSAGACQGTWAAQRVGGAAQAQVERPGRPIYNYAPGSYPPRYYGPPRYYQPAPLGGLY